jgi:hypothetical protein
MSMIGVAKEQVDNNNTKRLLSIAITNIQTAQLFLKEVKELGFKEFTIENIT